MGRVKQIAQETDGELEQYLDHLEWGDNPFTEPATAEEYVIPSPGAIADIASHIQNYTGFALIHSKWSGAGKTTLLRVLLEEFEDSHETVFIGEHNTTPYELVAIVADKLGVGKSSSTKLTEEKLGREVENFDKPVLLGVDEFGLNDPDCLHTLQFLNDAGYKIILTGMTSQYEAVDAVGSEGRAFKRRIKFKHQVEPFSIDQTEELIQRRIVGVSEHTHEEADDGNVPLDPFTEDAIAHVHEESQGIPAVMLAGLSELLSLGAYQYANDIGEQVTVGVAEEIDYPDPEADL